MGAFLGIGKGPALRDFTVTPALSLKGEGGLKGAGSCAPLLLPQRKAYNTRQLATRIEIPNDNRFT